MQQAGHEVLIKINDVRALIVCNSPGILGQQLRFCQINLLNTITVLFTMKNTYCLFQIKFITEYTNVQQVIITQILLKQFN